MSVHYIRPKQLCNLIHLQSIRNDAELQEGNVSWLKSRLAVLIEISTVNDAQRQAGALTKLSTDFKSLLSSLSEVRPIKASELLGLLVPYN